jgi:uncharacterized membrane protein YfcA
VDLVFLCLCAAGAGFVDAIVGGGGLIQLPALFLFLPAESSASIPAVLGTNKLSSICGTGMAAIQYARRITLPWKTLTPASLTALLCSLLGARTVTLLKPEVLRPVVIILLVLVAAYTVAHKRLGSSHAPHLRPATQTVVASIIGAVIGFYDGFFGPGTGSFLIFAFVSLLGFEFLTATAAAKIINFATNLSAVIYFAATDHVLYAYAIPMGLCNVGGSLAGARLAILRGNALVRGFFLTVVVILILRLTWELATAH